MCKLFNLLLRVLKFDVDYIVQKISEQSNRLSWNQVQSSSDSDEEPADKKKSKTYEETSNVKAKSWPLKFFFLANDQRIQGK